MRFYYPDTLDLPLPPGHRFPAGKYRMLRDRLIAEGTLEGCEMIASPLASVPELLAAHDAGYVSSVLDGTIEPAVERRIGLPWSEILVARSRGAVGGALAAARSALTGGLSGQLAGGTHHAHSDFGSGYCVFNDLAVTALVLLGEGSVERVAILDCDVHQGDGTAAIMAGRADVMAISLHGAKNFPFRKVPSTIDIGLPDGTEDRAYLDALDEVLPAVTAFRPDLLLYLSGADALASDRLGRLSLSFQGLAARDRMVVELCRKRGFPVSIAIGGGYADPIGDSVSVYANTFRTALDVWRGA